MPANPQYLALAATADLPITVAVGGLVETASLSLAELRALPQRTQITRHGASRVGRGRQMEGSDSRRCSRAASYAAEEGARAIRRAHCADRTGRTTGIDLEDAFHPQTILAYDLNDALPIPNGAPVRRVERQLSYKHAKLHHAHGARRASRRSRRQGRLLGRLRRHEWWGI
jgi:DMSO/TMAO reductase YedYZ molybdopterin-dependent catalytic subunit